MIREFITYILIFALCGCGVVNQYNYNDIAVKKPFTEQSYKTKTTIEADGLDAKFISTNGPFHEYYQTRGVDFVYDNMIINVRISNQYYKQKRKDGTWPLLPIATYSEPKYYEQVGCSKKEIEIYITLKTIENKPITPEKHPEIYIEKDGKNIKPLSISAYRQSLKAVFPLYCKDLDNTTLIVDNARFELRYEKGEITTRAAYILNTVVGIALAPVAISLLIILTITGGIQWN